MAAAIRVLILGGGRLYLEGLSAVLRATPDLEVTAIAQYDAATLAVATEPEPHVVIIDVSAVDVAVARAVRRTFPSAALVALAIDREESSIASLVEIGVRGYVTCDMSLDELTVTVRRVAAGETVYPRGFDTILLHALAGRRPDPAALDERLTIRELEVLGLLRRNLSNKEIANLLHISEATVKNHVHHVLEKLQVTRRGQAASYLLPLPRHVRNA